jgi:hypothetical protein
MNITCCWISRGVWVFFYCKLFSKTDNNALDIDAIYNLKLKKHNLSQQTALLPNECKISMASH